MKKNLCIIFLACVIVVASFTGCTTKTPQTASDTGSKSAASSSVNSAISSAENASSSTASVISASSVSTASKTSPAASGSTAFQVPIYDLKGATIRVYASSDWQDGASAQLYMNSFKQAEKVFNCKFTFTYYDDAIAAYNQLVTSYTAGVANFDLFLMRGYNVCPKYAASGTILDLSKYYDYKSDPAWQNAYVKNIGVWKGDRYSLSYGDVEPGYAIWYNKSLFAAANVPDPWTYVNSNTWNWNTFRDVCKKLTRDTNGDGKTDVWAFNAENPLSMFITTNGGKLIDTSTSPAKFAADSPQATEAIEYYKLLYGTDKVIPSSTSGLPTAPFDQMETGKLAMFPYDVYYGPYLVQKGIKASDLGWVYWPKGNSMLSSDYVIPAVTEPESWVVPAKVNNPKEIIAAVTYATAFWSKSATSPQDILSQQNVTLNNDSFLDILTGNNKTLYSQGSKNSVYTEYLNYDLAGAQIDEMFNKILTNQLSTSTALSSYKDQIQTLINKEETPNSLG